jgi:lipopolysaccharide/colanic/teichoic acid biosynthesis glycosyltransferase
MIHHAEAKSGAVWASKDDPGNMLVGKWLRSLRLDEFPLLFNVLKRRDVDRRSGAPHAPNS